jgi:hypothetical protein
VPFALTPAEVDNDPIDYRTTEGKTMSQQKDKQFHFVASMLTIKME